jgi:selenocysteine lyase/cysteine desulfurase
MGKWILWFCLQNYYKLNKSLSYRPSHFGPNMPQNRRHFIKQAGLLAASPAAALSLNNQTYSQITEAAACIAHLPAETAAGDEDFWFAVQRAFYQSPQFINLENGYYSPQPVSVAEAQWEHIRKINQIPSFYMRRHQFEDRDAVKRQLAAFAGCTAEEIVITRNTTEALDTVIFGLDLVRGDEAVVSTQDYGSMLAAFEQRVRRDGIVTRKVTLPLHPKSKSEVISAYEKAITPRTKVMLVTHMINLTGQVVPVREICDMAHGHGVEVIVDAAHSFAHLDFRIPDLHGDYVGTSLHKWLCAPLGAGLLYVKKEKISKVWPLFGDTDYPADDIRKFEHIGTHPCATHLTIADALRFHEAIGSGRKEERLRYLKNYWTEKAKDIPGVVLNTPAGREQSCGIANVGIRGKSPADVANYLYDKHRIFTVAIQTPDVVGIRVTPHLYTTLGDLDKFVRALAELSRS